MPSDCDDGPFGKGTGGQLRYQVTVRPGRSETVWIAVAATRADLAGALRDPDRQLAEKAGARARLGEFSKLDLPGDRQLQEAVDWGKQNLADLTQTATDLKLRFTDEGKGYPPPIATIPSVTFFGAGYPDYPWLFATDGEYTAFAAVALGQFEAAKAHLVALRDISRRAQRPLGQGRARDRHRRLGLLRRQLERRQHRRDGEVPERGRAAVALDAATTASATRSTTSRSATCKYIVTTLDKDGDGWPEGLGNVERPGMGPEKLDNTVYFIRGLYDLADMADAKRDRGDRALGEAARPTGCARGSTRSGGTRPNRQYADSLDRRPTQRIQQKHWIGVTPMEVELTDDGETVPGLAPGRPRRDRAGRARDAVLQRRRRR